MFVSYSSAKAGFFPERDMRTLDRRARRPSESTSKRYRISASALSVWLSIAGSQGFLWESFSLLNVRVKTLVVAHYETAHGGAPSLLLPPTIMWSRCAAQHIQINLPYTSAGAVIASYSAF
eukprot:474979-Pyramimonas_sp.AAC.1